MAEGFPWFGFVHYATRRCRCSGRVRRRIRIETVEVQEPIARIGRRLQGERSVLEQSPLQQTHRLTNRSING